MSWLSAFFSSLNRSLENLFKNLLGRPKLAGFLTDLLFTLIFLAFFGLLIYLIRKLFARLDRLIESWRATKIPALKIQTLEIVSADRLTNLLLWVSGKVRLILNLLLFYLFIPLFLSYFPQTRSFIWEYLDYIVAPLFTLAHGFLAFIPNLIFIGVTLFLLRQVLKLLRVLFSEVKTGRLSFPGFHPDWADPTFKLSRFLLIVFTIERFRPRAGPYFPGPGLPFQSHKSPARFHLWLSIIIISKLICGRLTIPKLLVFGSLFLPIRLTLPSYG